MNNRVIQYSKLYKRWRCLKYSVTKEFLMNKVLSKILESRNRKLTSLELDAIVNEMHKYEARHGSLFTDFRR